MASVWWLIWQIMVMGDADADGESEVMEHVSQFVGMRARQHITRHD